jgi:hypothetical protein
MKTYIGRTNLEKFTHGKNFIISRHIHTINPCDFIGLVQKTSFFSKFFEGLISLISSMKVPNFKLEERKQIYPFRLKK